MCAFVASIMAVSSAFATELTFDITRYAYEEVTDAGAFYISDKSKPVFISVGIRDWDRPKTNKSFRLLYTGEVTYGKVDYNSASTGDSVKEYYKARAEGYWAYRYNESISPYVGAGYRLLYDNSGGSYTSTNAWLYDRRSQYLYIPIGARFDLTNKLSIKAQYNLFLYGDQKSYTSVKAPNPNVTNEQYEGWGMDITSTYQYMDNWNIYGFFRHWDIEKSEIETGVVSGSTISWWEPDNTTNEIGAGISYVF